MTAQTDGTNQQGEPNGAPGQQQQGEPHGDGQQQQTPRWEEIFTDETPEQVREKLAQARKWETRAKENFEKAKAFDALEDSKKSPDQRTSEALEKAQREAAESTQKLIRYEVAAETGLNPQWLSRLQGNTKEELLADAEKLIVDLGLQDEKRQTRRGPAPDPAQGRGGEPVVGSPNEAFAQFMKNKLSKE